VTAPQVEPGAVRTRFCPSPTGMVHVGLMRTALFNWAHARHTGGQLVFRIEDTDAARDSEESYRHLLDSLRWLGIDWDEGPERGGDYGPYFQTQRLELYKRYADQLIAERKAYRCYCTREELEERRAVAEREKRTYKYEGTCRERTDVPAGRTSVVRFKMPLDGGSVSFTDQVIGTITKEHSDLDDWVMLRADGIPLYNYGCVIDDHLMEITLVGRGQEHINSTFPQLMLYGALGWEPPQFAHFPLILGPDREKLSKRRHPEADVMLHAKTGILPEALLNFVVRLGWGHGNDEVITLPQMIEWFGFDHVGTTSGVWNPEKLLWLNQQYFKSLPPERIAERLAPFIAARGLAVPAPARLQRIVLAFRERAKTLEEMAQMAAPYLVPGVTLDEKAAAKHLGPDSRALLAQVREALLALPEWSVPVLDGVIKTVSERAGVGMGKVAQPVRVAVTGNTTSPGIGETLELLGREEALARIDAALARA
jgi:glutamyl-tRNA synthetase